MERIDGLQHEYAEVLALRDEALRAYRYFACRALELRGTMERIEHQTEMGFASLPQADAKTTEEWHVKKES